MQDKYTLRDIAKELSIDFSTLRYYEINFKEHFSSPFNVIGSISYNKNDIKLFVKIHDLINTRGLSIDQVKSKLSKSNKSGSIIGVASGKGGVGKTTVTCNLALSLVASGKKVLICDLDLGLSNVHVHLGKNPEYNLYHVLNARKDIKEIIETTDLGVDIISAGSGIGTISALSFKQKNRLRNSINGLAKEYDVVFLDIGAGVTDNIMYFTGFADLLLLITTSDLAAITDVYAFIKVMLSKHSDKKFTLLFNDVANQKDAEAIYLRLKACVERFLEKDVDDYYWIASSDKILKSIAARTPLSYFDKDSKFTKQVQEIAQNLYDRVQSKSYIKMKTKF